MRTAILGAALVVAACRESDAPAPAHRDPASASAASVTNAPAAVIPSVAPSSAPSPSSPSSSTTPSSPASATQAPPFFPPLEKSIAADCRDPRVVLAARHTLDEAAAWAAQFFIAFPEFKLVERAPAAPMEVEVYRTQYGDKLFAQEAAPPDLAVVAKCLDHDTCDGLASAFAAAFAGSHPLPACGLPPRESPWNSNAPPRHVRKLAPGSLSIPGERAPWPEPCARLSACGARNGKPLPALCTGLAASTLRACAVYPSCEQVVACLVGSEEP